MNLTFRITREERYRWPRIPLLVFNGHMKQKGYRLLYNYISTKAVQKALAVINENKIPYVIGPAYDMQGNQINNMLSLHVKITASKLCALKKEIYGDESD